MIPAYNCAEYLAETLSSVLSQDPGESLMQIEVIDHCSTKDDPASVVSSVGRGRVGFHRKEVNEGPVSVFNECIRRSRGHLVHILHGDDYVLPGFYGEIERLYAKKRTAALFATRSFRVDQHGDIIDVSRRLSELENGSNAAKALFYETAIQFPSVVMRREFYEVNGGYSPAFSHVVDREMWVRAIAKGGGVVSPKVLACYRVSNQNDSSQLQRTGGNVIEIVRLNELFRARYPEYSRNLGLKYAAEIAETQARLFEKKGDQESAVLNWAVWRGIASREAMLKRWIMKIIRGFKKSE
jgi:glycosyltransferase involved in cell wall biosynthesis